MLVLDIPQLHVIDYHPSKGLSGEDAIPSFSEWEEAFTNACDPREKFLNISLFIDLQSVLQT